MGEKRLGKLTFRKTNVVKEKTNEIYFITNLTRSYHGHERLTFKIHS